MSDETTWRVEIIDIPTREIAEQVAEWLNYLTDMPVEPRVRIRLLRVSPEVTMKSAVDAALDVKTN